jgi:hypothetical protein
MRVIMKRLRWIGIGVALGWLFDPQRGAERRAQARRTADRVAEPLRAVAAQIHDGAVGPVGAGTHEHA